MGIAENGLFLANLRAAEHTSDRAIKQADAIVSEGVMVSSTVATRVMLRRSGDNARGC